MSDVAILGGGLAGLSLALQLKLREPELQVTVLEKAGFPVPEAAHKVGESTVELASHYFGHTLGLREHLETAQLPKLGLRFFFGSGEIQDRLEVGGSDFPPTSSYQLDRGRFENFLAQRCKEQGIELLDQTKVEDIQISEGREDHIVGYRGPEGTAYLEARWLVDASGRASLLKRKLNLRKASEHKASAVWFRVNKEIRIDDWSQEPRWREGHEGRKARWFSTNHLMGTGYWVWLIPLASGSTSVGIVVDESLHPIHTLSSIGKARQWMEKFEPQCASKVFAEGVEVQDFKALKNYAHDCERVYSSKRWFLTGEAGVFLDPFYSPGSDFIALSNTFIAHLISDAHRGIDTLSKTRFYNNLFLSFKSRTMEIFQDQYPIWGHSQVMPMKIVWDFATYWVLLAYLFFQDRLWEPAKMSLAGEEVSRIGKVNSFMQTYFRTSAKRLPAREVSGRIDFLSIKFLAEINGALGRVEDDATFLRALRDNAERLERFASEMISTLEFAISGREDAGYEDIEPSRELSDFFTKLGIRVPTRR